MARRTVVTLLDDLDHSTAAETVEFGLDRARYEIDLSEPHAAALRGALADYVAHARRTSGRRRRAASARRDSGSTRPAGSGNGSVAGARIDREQNRAMRDWARRQGMTVSDRGRVPTAVIEAYHNRRE